MPQTRLFKVYNLTVSRAYIRYYYFLQYLIDNVQLLVTVVNNKNKFLPPAAKLSSSFLSSDSWTK